MWLNFGYERKVRSSSVSIGRDSISLPTDSRVFGDQTGSLEGTRVTSGSLRHLGGILEEEEEGALRSVTKLEGVTKIGVIGDKRIFRVT